MSSLTQIDANRVNSQNSTGSLSPGGTTASSLNAMKSGIHAGSRIIRGEDHSAMSVFMPVTKPLSSRKHTTYINKWLRLVFCLFTRKTPAVSDENHESHSEAEGLEMPGFPSLPGCLRNMMDILALEAHGT